MTGARSLPCAGVSLGPDFFQRARSLSLRIQSKGELHDEGGRGGSLGGGEEFVGIKLLICLLPAWVWSMVGALELESLKLEESPIKYSSIIGVSLLINLFSGLLFIPIWGILGAAISSMLGFISLFIIKPIKLVS